MDKKSSIDIDYLTPRRHAPYLVEMVLKRHPEWTRGAEVGVAMGRTLLLILQKCPNLSMLAVDAFTYIPDSENSGLYEDMDHSNNEACVRAVAAAYPERVEILKGVSYEVAAQVPDESLDFVFIDASHMYEEVKKDIIAWSPKVKPAGWILGHDYCGRWPGVVKAVDEVFGTPMKLEHSTWGVWKGELR